jgi:hypothetical protein
MVKVLSKTLKKQENPNKYFKVGWFKFFRHDKFLKCVIELKLVVIEMIIGPMTKIVSLIKFERSY